jgi:hypothetical protein
VAALDGAFVVANLAGSTPSGPPANPQDKSDAWCLRQCSRLGKFGLVSNIHSLEAMNLHGGFAHSLYSRVARGAQIGTDGRLRMEGTRVAGSSTVSPSRGSVTCTIKRTTGRGVELA